MMSDAVILALIAGLPAVVSSILGFLNQKDIRRVAALSEQNEKHLIDTKASMVHLEKNTNSIKDELVKVTAEASRAKGNLEGRAELKEENDVSTEEHSG